MNFFFPDKGWLCMAENCTHNMHNLVPIRGALVRDAPCSRCRGRR
jgi:alkyl sulfatase BDS1-like metallo-beta-lactamase superfamily hydrolase